ncbi:MAG: hypothetical protein K2G25_00810 [Oscillospiraceae bacterium]|nr:hypothetical protein [Oscillospiraceae bacterium]
MKNTKIKVSAILLAAMTMLAYNGCGASDLAREKSDIPAENNAIMNADIAEVAGAEAGEAAPAAVPEGDYFADADAYDDAGDAEFAADGVAVMADAMKSAAGDVSGDVLNDTPEEMPIEVPEEVIPDENSRIGMLTAGEWRDHDNWGFFENLVNTGLVEFPGLTIELTRRIAVTVTDPEGNPLPNVSVTLEQENSTVLWQSMTDQNGIAYMFESSGNPGTRITVRQDDVIQVLELDEIAKNSASDEQGNRLATSREYAVTLETEKKLYPNTEIMFIVDTTGSMGDEMLFLQSDFSAIAEETGDEHTRYSVNFYKDEGDEYVTKCSGFTGDVQAIKNQLCAESASGGGDEPEAVAQILSETLSGDMWGQDSVKIAFLIYDAPPHSGTEDVLCQAIADASAKGIHLIPVVSSNGSRETELFGRACAICTNGSYVFLTDDSGIGGSHLEPIIGDYEVESLHDIIVRIIQNYKQS